MAKNKKSFIAYSDWNGMFKALPDEVAGKLIKHIFSYVNDENPSTDDYVINALFEQVKATLKRDLEKWEEQTEQRKKAGKRSAEVRKQNATVVNGRSISSTDSVSVSVSDSVNENEIKKEVFSFRKSLLELNIKENIVSDWLKVRKTKKATNTEIAFNSIKSQIEKSGLTANECIKKAVEKSWSGFNHKWIENGKPKNDITKSDEPDDGGWKIHRSKNG